MLAKKTVKNQITLPKKIVEKFPSVSYFDVRVEKGEIVLRPVDVERRSPEDLRAKLRGLGITQQDVREAVRWARARDR
jgi:bifunctional DNA-binding transcriptional regulator/antitoxin component of YhaV-PrlF toxin-antitoxin module